MLLVVFYGRRTFFLTISKEHGLKVFENRVLGRIFGYEKEEATRAECAGV
jgi:hypothetical protein